MVGTPASQQEGHCVAGSIPGRFVQSQTMMAGWMDVTFRLFTVGGDKEPAC